MTDMQTALHNLRHLVAVESDEDAARLAAPEALGQAAAFYASMGWPVFPCTPGDKTPLVKWRDRATTDAGTVAAWWRGTPQANIGLPTGAAFDVLDVDPDKGGYESLAELRSTWASMGTPMPDCLAVVVTGGGDGVPGRHLYVPVHPSASAPGTNFAPGLDYRGVGGYVIAPPSRLAGGGRYTWLVTPREMRSAA